MMSFINKPNDLLISQTIIIQIKALNIEMLPAAVGIVFKLAASTAIALCFVFSPVKVILCGAMLNTHRHSFFVNYGVVMLHES